MMQRMNGTQASQAIEATQGTPARFATQWTPGLFDYERLEVSRVAEESLRRGDAMARRLPRGQANLADQLRRALLSSFPQTAEGASRLGADRANKLRGAKAEASEAAAAIRAGVILGVVDEAEANEVRALLARQCAMLGRLAR